MGTVLLTILAYGIVFVFPHLVMSLGLLAGLPLHAVLFPLPHRVKTPILMFVGGVVGGAAAVGFGFLIFKWLVGEDSFGILPFLVTSVSIVYGIGKDAAKAREDQLSDAMQTEVVKEVAAGGWAMPIGETLGLIAGFPLFVQL